MIYYNLLRNLLLSHRAANVNYLLPFEVAITQLLEGVEEVATLV